MDCEYGCGRKAAVAHVLGGKVWHLCRDCSDDTARGAAGTRR